MTWQTWLLLGFTLALLWILWSAWDRNRLRNALGDPLRFRTGTRDAPSEGQRKVLDAMRGFDREVRSQPLSNRVHALRKAMNNFGGGDSREPEALGVSVTPVAVDGIDAEWVLGPNADPDRRLLYLHGGAFFVGSPLSHRPLTAALARRTGLSVLAIDYRLMPEHRRIDGIVDCQNAYRWILDNGPRGAGSPTELFVAGDSAGGSLTLVVSAWARDQGIRAPNGAIALSPVTDSTFRSPSMRDNADTDPMLGPGLGALMRIPRPVLLFLVWFAARMRPTNPLISPIHGDLSGLPPVLIHASEAEMLYDDCRRYALKAQRAGSPVVLETWPFMVHVWQIFNDVLPEANEALDRIEAFVASQRVSVEVSQSSKAVGA
ncbi:MAG: alpha/beta hydrolase [Myxococcota bacterium]